MVHSIARAQAFELAVGWGKVSVTMAYMDWKLVLYPTGSLNAEKGRFISSMLSPRSTLDES